MYEIIRLVLEVHFIFVIMLNLLYFIRGFHNPWSSHLFLVWQRNWLEGFRKEFPTFLFVKCWRREKSYLSEWVFDSVGWEGEFCMKKKRGGRKRKEREMQCWRKEKRIETYQTAYWSATHKIPLSVSTFFEKQLAFQLAPIGYMQWSNMAYNSLLWTRGFRELVIV